jgi:4-alpha-glucanotransferase
MALKRRVLEELAACAASARRRPAFKDFLAAHPQVADYAAFRAAGERLRLPWQQWPARLRDGEIRPQDYDPGVQHYHAYVQWLAHEQLRSLAETAQRRDVGLNLDLPLGVHTEGYDVWRERDSFALDMHGGAPPDLYFTKGQDWGFAPLQPEALRANGYRYFIAAIRHHLQFADLLRIDHVMGLHRLYWVPQGMGAGDGVYVRYHAEELYAILSLESHRQRARIVGENLGTVPANVNESMQRHGIYGMYVTQLEVRPEQQPVLGAVPPGTVASLNTHDLPTFAGFWRGLDIDERLRLGLLDAAAAQAERARLGVMKKALLDFLVSEGRLDATECDDEHIVDAFLAWLAAGRSRIMLVNLEDLWGETQPHNIPGTVEQHPNWRRKARLSFEAFSAERRIKNVLRKINRLRRRSAGQPRSS